LSPFVGKTAGLWGVFLRVIPAETWGVSADGVWLAPGATDAFREVKVMNES
jgi:hypothetical protein